MDDDLAITLGILLAVDEPTARHIAENLGRTFGTTAGKGANQTFNKTVGGGGGEARASGEKKGKEFAKGFSTGVKQIEDITKASLQRATNAAKQADIRISTIQRQGTTGGQVAVDRLRREQNDIHSLYSTSNQKILADAKRHNAAMIASDQQSAVRRTVLIRTALNNLTRVNQSVMTAILTAWRSHHQRRIADEQSANRKAEIELQGSMDRRLAKIKAGSRQQSLAATANTSASERANTALSGGVLGAVTGRGMGVASLFAGALGGREIFNILGEFQSIETAFKGIFREVDGGAPRTTQFLKDMQAFARETPFTLSQVSLAAQKMFANRIVDAQDIDATEQLTDKLRRLADAAAATGKTAGQMDMALLGITQIGSSGQLMMEELRQVTENIGLPMEEVAKSLGMTVAEMRDAMKEGAIGAEEGLDAIFDALTRIPGAAGASARQAKTLRGAMSQLRDVGEQLVIKFLMPVGNAFAAAALTMGKFGDQLISGKGAWKVARDALGGIVGALTAIIAAKGAIQVVKLLGIGLSAIAAAPVTAALVALVGVLSTFDGLRAKLASLVEGTKNWFLVGYRANTVIDSFSGFVKVITTVGKFARTVQDFTKALVVGTKDWFLVGYRISGVIDEFSNIVLFQTSLGAAARVIVDALRGIWDALGALASTRDFGEFRKALGRIAEDAGKALSPIKDALAEQFELGVEKAKEVALAAVRKVVEFVSSNLDRILPAGGGLGASVLIRLFGVSGGLRKIIGTSIVGAIGLGLISAIRTWDTGSAELSFASRVGVIVANGMNAAQDVRTKIGEFLGGLFTNQKVQTDPAELGRTIRDFVKSALDKGGGVVEIITGFFGRIGEGVGKALDSGSLVNFLIDVPRKIGRMIAEIGFSEEFLKAVTGLGAAIAIVALGVAGQFIRGFIEGVWARRGDIAKTIQDALNLGFSGGIISDIATRFVQVFVTAVIAAKGWSMISGLLKRVFMPARQFAVGLSAGSVTEARKGLFVLRRETEGTGSKAADMGVAFRKAFGETKALADTASKAAGDFRSTSVRAGQAVAGTLGPSGNGGRAILWGTGAIKHYADGWKSAAGVVAANARKMADTAAFAADVIRTKMASAPKVTSDTGPSALSRIGQTIDPRQFAPVQAVMGNLTQRYNVFRAALARDLPRFGEFVRGQASRAGSAIGGMATATVTTFKKMGQANSNYWAKYRGDATKGQQAVSAAMSVGASAFSGYMIGMSNSAAETGASILGAAGSIGQAFASEGPILGGLATAATLLGAWWASREKEAAKAAAEIKARADEIAASTATMASSITGTFESVGSSNAQAQAAAVFQVFKDLGPEASAQLDELRGKFSTTIRDISAAAADGGDGIAALREDLIASATADIFAGDAEAMSKFRAEVGAAAGEVDAFARVYAKGFPDKIARQAQEAFEAFADGGVSVEALTKQLTDMGLSSETANKLVTDFKNNISTGIVDTAALKSLEALGAAIDVSVENFKYQEDFAGALRTRLEALGPVGDRMVSTFDRIKSSLDRATSAYKSWIDATRGEERTGAETRIALDDLLKQRQELLKPPAEGEAPMDPQRLMDELLINDLAAQEAVGSVIANISKAIRQAGGGIDEVRAAVAKWFDDAIAGEGDQAGKDWLGEVKKSVLEGGAIEIQFGTRPAVEGIADIKTEFSDFINEAQRNQIRIAIEEAPDNATRTRLIREQLEEYGKDPVAHVAIMEAGGPRGYQAVLDAILADKDIIAQGVDVPVRAKYEVDTSALERYFTETGFPILDFNNFPVREAGSGSGVTLPVRPALSDGTGPDLQRQLDDIIASNPVRITVEAEVKPKVSGFFGNLFGNLFGKVKSNYMGGLETSPVLSTLAERGAEAIFPLTNPARMRQIMGIPQVARAFDAAGFGVPIAGNATGTNYAPVTVDQSQVNHFTIASDTPRATADQIVRRQRSARFLGGHTLPVVIR